LSNSFLLRGHLLCAAAEYGPVVEDDATRWFGENVKIVLDECQREGRLHIHKGRGVAEVEGPRQFKHCQFKGQKAPKTEVSLRDIDPIQIQVMTRGSTLAIDTLDQKRAHMLVHAGAIYLNQRQTYFVEELDLKAKTAWVVPRDPKRIDYYTESREHSQIVISGGGLARSAAVGSQGTCVVRCGAVTAYWRMYGFRKRAKGDHRIMDQVDLTLPSVEYPTQAVWMDLPGSVLQPLAAAGHSVDRGGLHALEHAMLSLAPLCCDMEAGELSCQHTRRDSDPNRYLLMLYESQQGGAGALTKVYPQWEKLLHEAVRLMEECPCDNGCPNCIIVPLCGEYNNGLDKACALKIGHALGIGRLSNSPQSEGFLGVRGHASVGEVAEIQLGITGDHVQGFEHSSANMSKQGESTQPDRKGGVFTHKLNAAQSTATFGQKICQTSGGCVDLD